MSDNEIKTPEPATSNAPAKRSRVRSVFVWMLALLGIVFAGNQLWALGMSAPWTQETEAVAGLEGELLEAVASGEEVPSEFTSQPGNASFGVEVPAIERQLTEVPATSTSEPVVVSPDGTVITQDGQFYTDPVQEEMLEPAGTTQSPIAAEPVEQPAGRFFSSQAREGFNRLEALEEKVPSRPIPQSFGDRLMDMTGLNPTAPPTDTATAEFESEQRRFQIQIQSLKQRISQLENRLKQRATRRDQIIQQKRRQNAATKTPQPPVSAWAPTEPFGFNRDSVAQPPVRQQNRSRRRDSQKDERPTNPSPGASSPTPPPITLPSTYSVEFRASDSLGNGFGSGTTSAFLPRNQSTGRDFTDTQRRTDALPNQLPTDSSLGQPNNSISSLEFWNPRSQSSAPMTNVLTSRFDLIRDQIATLSSKSSLTAAEVPTLHGLREELLLVGDQLVSQRSILRQQVKRNQKQQDDLNRALEQLQQSGLPVDTAPITNMITSVQSDHQKLKQQLKGLAPYELISTGDVICNKKVSVTFQDATAKDVIAWFEAEGKVKFDLRNPPPFAPISFEAEETGYPVALDMVLKSMNLRHFRERAASGLKFVITGETSGMWSGILDLRRQEPSMKASVLKQEHEIDNLFTPSVTPDNVSKSTTPVSDAVPTFDDADIQTPVQPPLDQHDDIEPIDRAKKPGDSAPDAAGVSLPANQEILLFGDVHKSGVHTVTSPPMRLFEFLTLEAGIQAEIKTLSTNVRVVRKKKIVFPGQLARHQYDDFLLAHGDTVVVHGIERTKPGGESPKSVEVTIIHPKTLPLIVKLEPNKAKASDVLAEAGVMGKLQIIRTCPNAPPGDLDAETVLIHGDILMVEPSPIVKSPALRIKKSVASRATVGQPLVSTILIENLGTAVAKEIVVQDQVPEGTKLTGTNPQGKLDDTKSKLTWLFESLEPGEQKQIKISVVPEKAGKVGTVATVAFKTQSGSTFGDSPTIHRTSPDEGTSYVDTEPPKNERKKAPDLDALAKEIAILKKSATEARTKYGPRHPKVLELERRERFMMSFLLKQRAESKTDNEAEVPFGADLDEESGQDGFGAAQDSCIEPNTPKQQLWTCQRLVAPRIPDTRLGWSLVYHLRPVG